MTDAFDETESDNLDGDLLTEDDLAGAVADDMASDDPVVRRLWDDLIRGEHAKAVMAEAETRRVIELNQRLQGQHRFQDGLGQLVARIPMSVYLHWTAVHGHEFWDHPDSLDFLARRAGDGRGNPGLLIETKGKPTIIVERKLSPAGHGSGPATCGEKAAAGVQRCSPAACLPRRSSAKAGPVRGRRGRWAAN